MKYAVDDFTLDLNRGELGRGDEVVAVEPRAFALLAYLVQNPDRLITKDELIEKIWDGRFVTDAAISTLIKSVRRALGDDGTAQKYIRTVHGRGFRFVGEVRVFSPAAPASASASVVAEADGVASRIGEAPTVAVLPFGLIGAPEEYGAIADAVPAELISMLSRLRWLKVIARGSSFRFRGPSIDLDTVRTALNADYLVTGNVELFGPSLTVSFELIDSQTGQVIWGDRLSGRMDDIHSIREEVMILITSALELYIPQHEAALARLRSPDSLDAWSFYHTGLQHMYRFNKTDNAIADGYFLRATELDPNFARAHAARSFTSFQAAFLRYSADRALAIDGARRHAERSLELDPMDPFANFNFGRAYWVRGDPAAGQAWLERAMSLSPSFAQSFYAHGWADVMAGDGEPALENLTKARRLSPLDPFLYAMQSAQGLAYLHVGELEKAAYWADQGARQPGAHYLISAIAAALCRIAGRTDEAGYWKAKSVHRRPDASVGKFFSAFPFKDASVNSAVRKALLDLGFPES